MWLCYCYVVVCNNAGPQGAMWVPHWQLEVDGGTHRLNRALLFPLIREQQQYWAREGVKTVMECCKGAQWYVFVIWFRHHCTIRESESIDNSRIYPGPQMAMNSILILKDLILKGIFRDNASLVHDAVNESVQTSWRHDKESDSDIPAAPLGRRRRASRLHISLGYQKYSFTDFRLQSITNCMKRSQKSWWSGDSIDDQWQQLSSQGEHWTASRDSEISECRRLR